jgi:proliferating cell nuclear antigen PCNA
MFHAKIEDVTLLRDSIATISELIDETEFLIKKDGLEMVSSDRAVVVVVDFFLSKSIFSEYHYEEDVKVGLNLLNLMQILKRAMPDDVLELTLDGNKLEVVLKGTSTRKFVIPLKDITKSETPDLQKLEGGFTSSFIINSDILSSGIEDAELVADSVIFTVRKDKFAMKAESDATSAQLDLPSGTENLKVIDMGEPVRARYSLDYLKKMIKIRKLSPEATIKLATDYPMKMQFDVPGKLRLGFILAPRVEE